MTDKKLPRRKKSKHDSDAYLNLARYIINGNVSNNGKNSQPEVSHGELHTPYGIVTGPQPALNYIQKLMNNDAQRNINKD